MVHKLILWSSLLVLMFACQTDKAVEQDVESIVETFISSDAFVEFTSLQKSKEKELLIGVNAGGRLLEGEFIKVSPTNFKSLKALYEAENYPNAEKIAALQVEIEEKRKLILPVLENIMDGLTKEKLEKFEALMDEKAGRMM